MLVSGDISMHLTSYVWKGERLKLSALKLIYFGFFVVLIIVFFAIYSAVLTKSIIQDYRGEQEGYERFKISESDTTSWIGADDLY